MIREKMKAGFKTENLDDVRGRWQNTTPEKKPSLGSFLSKFLILFLMAVVIFSMALWLSIYMGDKTSSPETGAIISVEAPDGAEPEAVISEDVTKLQAELEAYNLRYAESLMKNNALSQRIEALETDIKTLDRNLRSLSSSVATINSSFNQRVLSNAEVPVQETAPALLPVKPVATASDAGENKMFIRVADKIIYGQLLLGENCAVSGFEACGDAKEWSDMFTESDYPVYAARRHCVAMHGPDALCSGDGAYHPRVAGVFMSDGSAIPVFSNGNGGVVTKENRRVEYLP